MHRMLYIIPSHFRGCAEVVHKKTPRGKSGCVIGLRVRKLGAEAHGELFGFIDTTKVLGNIVRRCGNTLFC